MAETPSDVRDLKGWWTERGEVSGLIRRLIAALDNGQAEQVDPTFREFESVIRDHLRTEEDVVFPMAEERSPEQAQPIHSLRLAHIGIRGDLERIGEQIGLAHLNAARAMLEAFLDSFSAHERLEDQLLHVLKNSGTS